MDANWFYSRIDQSIGCHSGTEEHMNRDHWRGYRGGGGRAANGVLVERKKEVGHGHTRWATVT